MDEKIAALRESLYALDGPRAVTLTQELIDAGVAPQEVRQQGRAEAMLELAVGRVEKEEFPHADEVRPLYLREPDVNISWKTYREEGPWAESSPA